MMSVIPVVQEVQKVQEGSGAGVKGPIREEVDDRQGPRGRPERHPLDNPVRWSLAGPHAHLAGRRGAALRYPADVAPFAALPDEPGPADWADLAALAGPGAVVTLTGPAIAPPDGWEVVMSLEGVQMVGDDVAAAYDGETVRLGTKDVPEMLDLVQRTQPGPLLDRTVEMGTYLGIRRDTAAGHADGSPALVAMAGERLHPQGWTEISAVCTDAAFRGQGLASRLVLAVAAGIRERGEIPFLHAVAGNVNAIRLYESIGFRLRRRVVFAALRVPADAEASGAG